MNIKPCGHRVVIKPNTVEEKTEGGLYKPDTVKRNENMNETVGTLVAVGEGCWKEFADGEPWAKVGDIVVFCKNGGVEAKGDDEEVYKIMNDEDIVAVIG